MIFTVLKVVTEIHYVFVAYKVLSFAILNSIKRQQTQNIHVQCLCLCCLLVICRKLSYIGQSIE